MFTLEEIQAKQKYHQGMADQFLKLWNEDIETDTALFAFSGTHRNGSVYNIDMKSYKVRRLLKDFVYELCAFHVNERIKWDIILDSLIKKDPETIGKILKP